MTIWRRPRSAALLALTLAGLSEKAPRVSDEFTPGVTALGELPPSTLAVRTAGGWHRWWVAERAPVRWTAPVTSVISALSMRPASDGVEWGELTLTGSGEAWRTRLVVVRVDPGRIRFVLDTATRGSRPAWTIDRASARALFAVNAGQFGRSYPWGLVVLDGHVYLPGGSGPLVSTIAVDSSGAVSWGDATLRTRGARWAFQSYPTLLRGGEVSTPLRSRDLGVDVEHRDARLAIGRTADGHLLFALTRFDALGAGLDFVPFGLTAPEMAAVMGALGARDAVLLDGGISAQMSLRHANGAVRRWTGLRSVPLGLVLLPRSP